MSVLPLPPCPLLPPLPGGSYAEELVRRRELPVPPLPKRCGALARSEDNLSGLVRPALETLLARTSSWTGLGDTFTMAIRVKRTNSNVGRSLEDTSDTEDEDHVEHTKQAIFKIVSDEQIDYQIADDNSDNADAVSTEESFPLVISENNEKAGRGKAEGHHKRREKISLFRSAIGRLSLRTGKKKQKKNNGENIPNKIEENPKKPETVFEDKDNKEIFTGDYRTQGRSNEEIIDEQMKTSSQKGAPSSTTSSQSRPISELDAALRRFNVATVSSRNYLSMSRPDISTSIIKSTPESRPGRPLMNDCPPTLSSCWRQRPPPANHYLDSQWKKLSASILDMNHARRGQVRDEACAVEADVSLTFSNKCLGMGDVSAEKVEAARMTKAQSMLVLDIAGLENKVEVRNISNKPSDTNSNWVSLTLYPSFLA